MFNQEEVDLIKDGYRIAYEYRAARMTKAEAEKHLKNYKKENKDSKLVFSDNEFGGNWRIWAKKNMAKGGKVKPGKHSRADLGKIYKEVVGYDISEDDKEATAQDIIDLMKGYDKDHYKSYKTKPFADKGVYKAGGKIRNLSRDRQFKSQEPHEQKYVRKTTPRNPKYKIDKAAIKAAKSIGKRRK